MVIFWFIRKIAKGLIYLLIAAIAYGFYSRLAGRILLEARLDDGGRAIVRLLPSSWNYAFLRVGDDPSPIHRFEYYRPGQIALDTARSYRRPRFKATKASMEKGDEPLFSLDGQPIYRLTFNHLWEAHTP